MSEREADETAKFGEVQRWSTDSEGDEEPITQTLLSLNKSKQTMRKTYDETKGESDEMSKSLRRDSTTTIDNLVQNDEAVGIKVAKDFGSLGVYFGSVLSVEYDSDDEKKANPFYYCVKYSDGDTEDLNADEFGFARELCIQMELDAVDAEEEGAVTSDTGEDESYRPSPKVFKMPLVSCCCLFQPNSIYPFLNCITNDRKSVLGDRTKVTKMNHRHRNVI